MMRGSTGNDGEQPPDQILRNFLNELFVRS